MRASPFFDGVAQVDVTVAGTPTKLPIFYHDGTAMTALFPARYGALRRLLPDPRYVPARLAPGIGVVAISAFEYRATDIGAYNELAVAVLLNEPWFRLNAPGRALLSGLHRGQLHAYVHHLPVTTEATRMSGVGFWGYPKFVAGIEFSDAPGRRSCRLTEGAEEILRLSAEDIATPGSEQLQVFSHLWMDRQPQSSEFKLNVSELGRATRRCASLELGARHPIARELADLLLSRRAVHYQLMRRFEGILYGPDRLTLPLLEWARTTMETAEPVGAA